MRPERTSTTRPAAPLGARSGARWGLLALAAASLAAGLETAARAQDRPPPGQQPPGQQPEPERKIQFTFRRASIQAFLGYLSREGGFTFIEEAAVQGDITAVAERPLSRDEALEVLRSWLLPKGRALVRTGDVVRIVTLEEAKRRGLPVRIGASPAQIPESDEMVTQVMTLKYVRSDAVKSELAGLLSDKGTLMAEAGSNTLVVTDTSASIRRFAEVLAALDQAITSELHVRVFRLKNARSNEVAQIVRDLFSGAATTAGQQARGGGQGGRGGRGGGGGPQQDPRQAIRMMFAGGGEAGGGGGGAAAPGAVNVSEDARTNSVVVTASQDQLRLIEGLVRDLDSDPAQVVTELRAIRLVNADATALAATLTALFQDEQVQGQQPAQNQRGGRGGQGGQGGGEMAQIVRRFAGLDDGGQTGGVDRYTPKPKITTDVRTNTLLVTASPSDMAMIEKIAKDLDQDPTDTTSVMVIQLQHAEASVLAPVIQNALQAQTGAAGGAAAGRGAQQQGRGQQARAAATTPINAGNADLVGQVTVTADEAGNALVVTSSPRNFDRIRGIVRELDMVRREVFIECLIAEVQLTDRGELGIQWNAAFTNSAENAEEGTQSLGTDFGLDALRDGLRYTTTSDKLSGLLRALKTEGRLNILSSPKILVLENSPAEISVGQEVPFVTNSRITQLGDTVNTIQYRDVGIILRVTPQISSNGAVRMTVHPEVSSIAPDAQSVPISEGVRSPTFNKEFADTTIVVQDGQTAVIGGLIRDSFTETVFKIPFLGDIPILGRLFGSTTREKVKQELVVFLTPHVIERPAQLRERSQAVIQEYAYVAQEVLASSLDRWLRGLTENTHAWEYNRGTVLLEGGRIDEAIKHLEKARDLMPSDAATRLNLGLALAQAGLHERAEAELRQAHRLDPADPEAAYDLGAVTWRKGDVTGAAHWFAQALVIDPTHAEAARWLQRAQVEQQRLEQRLLAPGGGPGGGAGGP